MKNHKEWLEKDGFLYGTAAVISLILSCWLSYHAAIVNPDAVCYLLSAQSIGELGLSGAMHLCVQAQWPFFPALIYAFVQVTHVSYAFAAYFLDAIFTMVSVLAFILIIKQVGGNKRVQWFAAAVILLSHEFNSVREYIIRDHGFWAGYLLSILFLLRCLEKPTWKTALAWSISLIVATLFRIEGAIFLLAMPFVVWLYPRYTLAQRAGIFCRLNLSLVVILVGLASWLLLNPQQTLDKLGRVAEVTNQFQQAFSLMAERYRAVSTALAQNVLPMESAKHAGFVLALLMVSWYVVSLIGNLSLVYAVLVVYAWTRRLGHFKQAALLVLFGYLLINLIVTSAFFAERLFLSKRYILAFSLVWMVWVPFALDDLWQRRHVLSYRLGFAAAAFFILISSAGGIFDFGYSKTYVKEAGVWLAQHVPNNASLYANDYQLMYYSNHFGDQIFALEKTDNYPNNIAQGHWKQYDYIALRLAKQNDDKNALVLAEIKADPVQVFTNKRGDRVMIFDTKKSLSNGIK